MVAHPALEIECLTTAQLAQLWRAGSSVHEYAYVNLEGLRIAKVQGSWR